MLDAHIYVDYQRAMYGIWAIEQQTLTRLQVSLVVSLRETHKMVRLYFFNIKYKNCQRLLQIPTMTSKLIDDDGSVNPLYIRNS